MQLRIIIFLLFCCFFKNATALRYFDHYTTGNGSGSATTTSILQDEKEVLWINKLNGRKHYSLSCTVIEKYLSDQESNSPEEAGSGLAMARSIAELRKGSLIPGIAAMHNILTLPINKERLLIYKNVQDE
ncbi:MAG: hypothetical protein J7539_14525 [Niabella sp.]|nr:hypothetical protein [Niabella sp.]